MKGLKDSRLRLGTGSGALDDRGCGVAVCQ